MDKKKFVHKIILIVIFIILGISSINIYRYQTEPRFSGGKHSHLYYASGKITAIDIQDKKIKVSLSENKEYFQKPNIWLDCSKELNFDEICTLNSNISFSFLLPFAEDLPISSSYLSVYSVQKLD